jgi:hypothetical protein
MPNTHYIKTGGNSGAQRWFMGSKVCYPAGPDTYWPAANQLLGYFIAFFYNINELLYTV